jgi:hypothetical protein
LETLSDRIERDGALNELDAVGWAIRLAKRLEALHQVGVAHGSISPACVITASADRTSRASMVDLRRTPDNLAYQSPERLHDKTISPADDTWALAATLYAVLTAKPPFGGAQDAAFRERVQTGQPPPLAVLDLGDDDLQLVFDGAFERDLSKRTTSVVQLRQALEAWHPDPLARQLPPLEDADDEDDDDDDARTVMRSVADHAQALASLAKIAPPAPPPDLTKPAPRPPPPRARPKPPPPKPTAIGLAPPPSAPRAVDRPAAEPEDDDDEPRTMMRAAFDFGDRARGDQPAHRAPPAGPPPAPPSNAFAAAPPAPIAPAAPPSHAQPALQAPPSSPQAQPAPWQAPPSAPQAQPAPWQAPPSSPQAQPAPWQAAAAWPPSAGAPRAIVPVGSPSSGKRAALIVVLLALFAVAGLAVGLLIWS